MTIIHEECFQWVLQGPVLGQMQLSVLNNTMKKEEINALRTSNQGSVRERQCTMVLMEPMSSLTNLGWNLGTQPRWLVLRIQFLNPQINSLNLQINPREPQLLYSVTYFKEQFKTAFAGIVFHSACAHPCYNISRQNILTVGDFRMGLLHQRP